VLVTKSKKKQQKQKQINDLKIPTNLQNKSQIEGFLLRSFAPICFLKFPTVFSYLISSGGRVLRLSEANHLTGNELLGGRQVAGVIGVQSIQLLQGEGLGDELLDEGGAVVRVLLRAKGVEDVTGGREGPLVVSDNAQDLGVNQFYGINGGVEDGQLKRGFVVLFPHVVERLLVGGHGVELLAGKGLGLLPGSQLLGAEHQAGEFWARDAVAVGLEEGIQGFEGLFAGNPESLDQPLTGVLRLPEGQFPTGRLSEEEDRARKSIAITVAVGSPIPGGSEKAMAPAPKHIRIGGVTAPENVTSSFDAHSGQRQSKDYRQGMHYVEKQKTINN
jgi:hypothetical protein